MEEDGDITMTAKGCCGIKIYHPAHSNTIAVHDADECHAGFYDL